MGKSDPLSSTSRLTQSKDKADILDSQISKLKIAISHNTYMTVFLKLRLQNHCMISFKKRPIRPVLNFHLIFAVRTASRTVAVVFVAKLKFQVSQLI